MTREEEIVKASTTFADREIRIGERFINSLALTDEGKEEVHNDLIVNTENERQAFKEGARWADRTMIEKAVEWLDCNVDNYLFIDYLNTAGIKWDKFINDFKQAMKGE